ncbi:MAG: diguanylate cyclase [Desulfobacterales bacterium]|nr:diguanylate cyclase [Desulfobacterales bacterium]
MENDEIYDRQPLILIVDDTIKNLQVLGSILKDENYKLAIATNGNQAISTANEIKPDLILLDVMMPELDGLETCKILKSMEEIKDIPVIFLTAKVETEDIVEGFKVGAIDYIIKPFNSYELKARVKTHIELKISKDLLKKKNAILKKLSITDSLTGLFNRRYTMDALSRLIEENTRYRQPLSISMLDIDDFKKVNDEHGHIFGDEVIVKISSSIEGCLRKTDIVGRYGGEEFIILFAHTNLKGAVECVERIIKSVEKLKLDNTGTEVTISAGVCENKDEDVSAFVKKADDLLYTAKKKGKNRVEF